MLGCSWLFVYLDLTLFILKSLLHFSHCSFEHLVQMLLLILTQTHNILNLQSYLLIDFIPCILCNLSSIIFLICLVNSIPNCLDSLLQRFKSLVSKETCHTFSKVHNLFSFPYFLLFTTFIPDQGLYCLSLRDKELLRVLFEW